LTLAACGTCSVPRASVARPLREHSHQRGHQRLVVRGARRHGPRGVRAPRRQAQRRHGGEKDDDGDDRCTVAHMAADLISAGSARCTRLGQPGSLTTTNRVRRVLCSAPLWTHRKRLCRCLTSYIIERARATSSGRACRPAFFFPTPGLCFAAN
jgi:hypothetical protein